MEENCVEDFMSQVDLDQFIESGRCDGKKQDMSEKRFEHEQVYVQDTDEEVGDVSAEGSSTLVIPCTQLINERDEPMPKSDDTSDDEDVIGATPEALKKTSLAVRLPCPFVT
jgi:hypothetical protein